MNKITKLFINNSKAIVTYLLGFYLIIVVTDMFDRKSMNVAVVHGFWFFAGLYVGFYWSQFVEHLRKKQSPPTLRILKREESDQDKKDDDLKDKDT